MGYRLDPRAKLYLLLLANLLLFFHVNTVTEILMTALFLFPIFLAGRYKMGLRLLVIYGVLAALDLLVVPVAGNGFLLNFIALLAVGIRMLLPCIVTGAYAFATTTVGEMVCALRKMHVPETVIIPCMVVIRFFPTVREDYRQIRNAMALRGIAAGRAAILRHPAQTLEYILIPLLMNGNNVASDLSVAALTKGIGLKGRHTCMTQIRLGPFDWCYMAVCTAPLLCFLFGIL